MVFLCMQVVCSDALMLAGGPKDVLLETRVPDDVSLRGRGFRQCVSGLLVDVVEVMPLNGLMMCYFQHSVICIMLKYIFL